MKVLLLILAIMFVIGIVVSVVANVAGIRPKKTPREQCVEATFGDDEINAAVKTLGVVLKTSSGRTVGTREIACQCAIDAVGPAGPWRSAVIACLAQIETNMRERETQW
jgi:hypothetical protein